jgi:hypothetical protein
MWTIVGDNRHCEQVKYLINRRISEENPATEVHAGRKRDHG